MFLDVHELKVGVGLKRKRTCWISVIFTPPRYLKKLSPFRSFRNHLAFSVGGKFLKHDDVCPECVRYDDTYASKRYCVLEKKMHGVHKGGGRGVPEIL